MSCCSHLPENSNVTRKTPNGCEECLKLGDRWIHLRLCATCGHVGCCDDSKNKHAIKLFHPTNHPFIKSFEPDEDWGWCYVDELFIESFPNSLTTEWCGVLGATRLKVAIARSSYVERTRLRRGSAETLQLNHPNSNGLSPESE